MAVSPIDGSIAMPSKSSAISLIHFETDAKGQRRPTRTVEFGDESRKWNTNRIYSVAFSTDGNFIAAARADEEDYPISVWDMRTRKPIHTLTGHSDNVSSITVSPDSRILASGGKDQTVRLWDLASGKLIRTFTGHRTSIWSVAFSPKGRWLASTAADGTVKLWDCQSTPKQLPLRGTSRGFGPAVFSPDGHELRAAVEDGRLRDWSVETGAVLRQHDWILVENESLLGLSPDYRTLAYQTPEDGLWLLSIPANRRSKIVGGRFFGSPSFSANGAICVVSDNKSLVSIVDTERQRAVCRLQFTANQDAPSGVIPLMSPDGKFLAVQNEHEWLVWIYALAKNGASQQLLKTISAEYRPLCFSSDSATLAMASAGAVYLLDMRTFEFVKSIRSYSSAINKAAFSPDGRSLVFGLADRTVRVSDVVSGEELFTIRAHSHPIFSLALSPDANALLSYANGPGKPTEAILHRLIPGGLE
jgi:WD40 repeat protein